MFDKVLVAEDIDAINKGVLSVLADLHIKDVDQVQYCDDAYLRVKKAAQDNTPFDLLITDLSFKTDHRKQKYSSGEELIQVLKKEHPHVKIIAYTIEDRLQKVRRLVNDFKIEAYVCKGRRGLIELKEAIAKVAENKTYVSPEVANALSPNIDLEIKEYDIELVKQLSMGLSQKEIGTYFNSNNISPSSLSSIEKNINSLRTKFKANNVIHLVAIVKDLGLI